MSDELLARMQARVQDASEELCSAREKFKQLDLLLEDVTRLVEDTYGERLEEIERIWDLPDSVRRRTTDSSGSDSTAVSTDSVLTPFEEVGVKQAVFGEIEKIVAEDAILATNTSSLSVAEIGSTLAHPERLVGFHFFNPVAVMPLIEIVSTDQTADAALSTAFVVAKALGKNGVLTADAPGFVVNRLLAKVMGEAARAVYEGTPVADVERAFAPLGLPMGPFQLIDLVSWKVAAHVQDTMTRAFPDRFFSHENFHRLAELDEVVEKDKGGRVTGFTKAALKTVKPHVGSQSVPAEEILRRVQDGLAQEIRIMLDEKVVPEVEDIDLCLILGAGWPFIDGGASPYLDREGASERVFGATFHQPPIRGIAQES